MQEANSNENDPNIASKMPEGAKSEPESMMVDSKRELPPEQLSVLKRFTEGAERRLDAHSGTVLALAECMGRIYSGGKDDTIRVWNKNSLELEKVMELEHGAAVWSMASWQSKLMTGHDDGKIRVWNLSSGQCEQVLEGHEDGVNALAVCGSRLASASDDCTVRLWAMEEGPGWPCERTLEGHRGLVSCLAVWENMVISGSWDDSIRIWDVETGALVKTLAGHADTVMALLVHDSRLLSASVDGKVRVWALGGDWAALRSLVAYPSGTGQWVRCLAACPAGLVAGSFGPEDAGRRFEVQVWDPETLEVRRKVQLPGGQRVLTLLGTDGGEVWGAVGDRSVAVWGRE
jgi:WD40 repeat protein